MLATTATEPRGALVATAIIIVALIVLSVAIPYAVLVGAPGLVLVGVRTLRRQADPSARTLGWVAVVCGILLVALIVTFVVGLMATGTGGVMSDSGTMQQVRP